MAYQHSPPQSLDSINTGIGLLTKTVVKFKNKEIAERQNHVQVISWIVCLSCFDLFVFCIQDLESTNADLVSKNGDLVTQNNELVATNADLVATNADLVATNADLEKKIAELARKNQVSNVMRLRSFMLVLRFKSAFQMLLSLAIGHTFFMGLGVSSWFQTRNTEGGPSAKNGHSYEDNL